MVRGFVCKPLKQIGTFFRTKVLAIDLETACGAAPACFAPRHFPLQRAGRGGAAGAFGMAGAFGILGSA